MLLLTSPKHTKRALYDGGNFLLISGTLSEQVLILTTALSGGPKALGGVANETLEGIAFLKDQVEEGELRPVVDRVYPIDEVVEAHRYVEAGHKKGNVVISVV